MPSRIVRVARNTPEDTEHPLLKHPELRSLQAAARKAVASVGSLAKQQSRKSPDERSGTNYRVASLRSFATVLIGGKALESLAVNWHEANKEIFNRTVIQVLEEKYGPFAHIKLKEPYKGDNVMTHDTSLNFVAEITLIPQVEQSGRPGDWLPVLRGQAKPTPEAKERGELEQVFQEARLSLTKLDAAIESARSCRVEQANIVREKEATLARNEEAAAGGAGTTGVAERQVATAQHVLEEARGVLEEKRAGHRDLRLSRPVQQQFVENARLEVEKCERSYKLEAVVAPHEALMLAWRDRQSAPSPSELGFAGDLLKAIDAELTTGVTWLEELDEREARLSELALPEGDGELHKEIRNSVGINLKALSDAKRKFEPRYEDLAFARDELDGLFTKWSSALRHAEEREQMSKLEAQLQLMRKVPELQSSEGTESRLHALESGGLAARRRKKALPGPRSRQPGEGGGP